MFRRKQPDGKDPVKSYSIFIRLERPLILLAILNAVLLLLVLYVMRVPYQLNKNSYDLCQKQVDNRQKFLQSRMTDNWIQLDQLASYINLTTDTMMQEHAIDLEKLDSSTAECAQLLLRVVDRMIQELYTKQTSGIYLVFNTHDLKEEQASQAWKEKTGLYIRDKDPLSASSERYADLLLVCSPAKVVQQRFLSTDAEWEQKFRFDAEHPYEDWLLLPGEEALRSPSLQAIDCGLWSIKDRETDHASLTYSVPLALPDGRLYGVLGIEILPSYIDTLLPYSELDETGFYGLYLADDESEPYSGQLYSTFSKNSPYSATEGITLTPARYGGYQFECNGTTYQAALTPLSLYSRNTPFEDQHWYVLGAVPGKTLFAFSTHVSFMMILSSFLILIFGTISASIASWHIAKPILDLRRELTSSQTGSIPQLSKTGILEVDDFAAAITDLSQNVVNSSKRFLSIMEMSSIDMSGYEVDIRNNFLFVTDNYFQMFHLPPQDTSRMTPEAFSDILEYQKKKFTYEQTSMNSTLYSIRDDSGTVRYIHVQEKQIEDRRIGVAEDVTLQILERKRIERERDYDLLTGIYNRRAFTNEAKRLLARPDEYETAIAIMIDLDNLKNMNDTYGHEWGDRYIVAAARCIQQYSPANSICSRVSGDEFNILMYGFHGEAEAARAMEQLWNGFNNTTLLLPDGTSRKLSASGGYVLVTDEHPDIHQLIKYADFAMYRIKEKQKGCFERFDFSQYLAFEVEKEHLTTFRRILQNESIRYVFQPIVSARTSDIYGYEALMRITDNENMTLNEFLAIAKQEDALEEIEHLTWFKALPAFQSLIHKQLIRPDLKLFINSQANHMLSSQKQHELIERFRDIRENVVTEVVETDDLTTAFSYLLQQKPTLFSQHFALDDYGTGYNNERNLIYLMPEYVKIDMSLIRDVEKYQERQKLISGLLSFAHEKDMLILAEGVETIAELHCLLTLGVDLFQGYLFSRPAEVPGSLNQEALDMLRNYIQNQS